MSEEFVVVLTTLPANSAPSGFARTLVGERLAACVNILPAMTSVYRWEDGIEEEPEYQLVIKTARLRLPALKERLRTLHPYDVPELIVLPIIDGSEPYLRWIGESV
jgi:periplasmic divalent cation tolerance protein